MHELSASQSPCLSDLEIDEWLAGELGAADSRRCLDHVARCADCRSKQRSIEHANAAFYARSPSFAELSSQVRSRKQPAPSARHFMPKARGRRAWVAAPLTAAAIALLGVLAGLRPGSPAVHAVRSKGAARLGYYVKRGTEVVRGEETTTLRTGDALRFVYSSDHPTFFALFDLDADGAGALYPSRASAVQLPPGNDRALDFSIELDDTSGSARVIGLFCAEPFDLETARKALSSRGSVAGCQRAELELTKR